MGKRGRAKARAIGWRKQPTQTKVSFAKEVLADLKQMDSEVKRVIVP